MNKPLAAIVPFLLLLFSSNLLHAQTPPPGQQPSAAEKDRICKAIELYDDFEDEFDDGGSLAGTPEPLKKLAQARAANARKFKPRITIVEPLTGKPWGASGWTAPEYTVDMTDSRGIYSHWSSGVGEDEEFTRLDNGDVEGSGPENGYSVLFANMNLAQLLGHEAHRHVQELCNFSGCGALIKTHGEAWGNYPQTQLGLLALQQAKDEIESNLNQIRVDLLFWTYCLTLSPSAEDLGRLKLRIAELTKAIKGGEKAHKDVCAEIAKR